MNQCIDAILNPLELRMSLYCEAKSMLWLVAFNIFHPLGSAVKSEEGCYRVTECNNESPNYNSVCEQPLATPGVGPVDNRPSTIKLHPFVRKKEEEKNVTHDT